MGKERIFTQEETNEIIELFTSYTLRNKHKLAEKFHTSHDKITKLLNEYNVNSDGREPEKKKINYSEGLKRFNSQLKENHQFIAVCKKTGEEFRDYSNKSGQLSKHIIKLYPDIEPPISYIRTNYLSDNNQFWHQQYFDIIQREIIIVTKPVINIEARNNEIVRLYSSGELKSIPKLGKKFKMTGITIRKILTNNNIQIGVGGSTTHGLTSVVDSMPYSLRFTVSEGKDLIAKCLTTGTIIKNIDKTQQHLNNHIKKTHNISIPSTRHLKVYLVNNNESWYKQYFEFIEVEPELSRKCQYCDYRTTETGFFGKHLKDVHNMTVEEHLENYPEDAKYHERQKKRMDLLKDEDSSVICQICNKRFVGITDAHLTAKHNMTVTEYKDLYGENSIFSKNTVEKLSKKAIEVNKTLQSNYTSKAQIKIKEYIEEKHNLEVIINNKSALRGTEIDIYVPSKNFGIEYNGLRWHNEFAGKHKDYHLNKTILATESNIFLIHIFEDEWVFQEDAVLNRINNVLNSAPTNINYEIKKISEEIANDYLRDYDLNGIANSSIYLGAYNSNELEGVLSFSLSSDGVYILERASGFRVINELFEQCINYFKEVYKPTKIITYLDRRWYPYIKSTMYEKAGFKNISDTEPNYWYTRTCKKRENKNLYTKDILVSQGFDPNKTESDIMSRRGFKVLWDCGISTYELVTENS